MSATLTITEAAELLGISRNSAYEAARSGNLAGVPVLRVGRRLLVPAAPLRALLGLTLDKDHTLYD
ncbi:MAG: helix-turn-helix domain-containing protein [Acidobacteria bacterium]|nr:helix-turn-helix domain-containing protein [Acidobacteriota bacterium]